MSEIRLGTLIAEFCPRLPLDKVQERGKAHE